MKNSWIIALNVGFLATAGELSIPLKIDRELSSLTTTLCVQETCSSDTHPLDGEVLLALPCADPPTHAGIRDFRLAATTNHQANLDFGFGGKVTAVLDNLVIRHAAPSASPPSETVAAGRVIFHDVPSRLAGALKYQAGGLACVVVQLAGLKCDDNLDLASRPTNRIDQLESQLDVSGGRVKLTGKFKFSEYIDPSQEDIGQVAGNAVFTAVGDFRPTLEIDSVASGIRLRWCRLFDGFRLERTSNLGGTWQAVDAVPQPSAEDWSVTLPNEGSNQFYRLRSP